MSSEAAARRAVIEAHCRELKLPHLLRDYEAIARQGEQDGWGLEDFLLQVLEAEVNARRQAAVERRPRSTPKTGQ